jgi:hypothetical protein
MRREIHQYNLRVYFRPIIIVLISFLYHIYNLKQALFSPHYTQVVCLDCTHLLHSLTYHTHFFLPSRLETMNAHAEVGVKRDCWKSALTSI